MKPKALIPAFLSSKDMALISEKSATAIVRLRAAIRKAYHKPRIAMISSEEFSQFTGLSFAEIERRLNL